MHKERPGRQRKRAGLRGRRVELAATVKYLRAGIPGPVLAAPRRTHCTPAQLGFLLCFTVTQT